MGVIETLDNLANALKTPPKLAAIGGMAAGMIRGHIHGGQGFAPLSPAAAAYRGAGRPLQDTGALRDSITFSLVNERTVSVGTNKPYAALQNNGGVINAKKNWLWIPAAGTRQLQRRYGYSVTGVLNGLKASGYSIFRKGRTMCYREKRRSRNGEGKPEYKSHVIFYLKKSVEIPARPFFYLTGAEINTIAGEVCVDLNQL